MADSFNVTAAGAGDEFVTSRIDDSEASCVAAICQENTDFLLTDHYRGPELHELVGAEVVLSPVTSAPP